VLVRESFRAGCPAWASEDIDLNELRVDEGLQGVPDLALFFIDCEIAVPAGCASTTSRRSRSRRSSTR
jgi:hypothetical protein